MRKKDSVERIQEKVKLLSEPRQYQVDFVDYLLSSLSTSVLWSKLSLRWALRGAEDEEWPEYTTQDRVEQGEMKNGTGSPDSFSPC